jgi:two-component system, cell cycle sensor histidine kinase and response regulator CckA
LKDNKDNNDSSNNDNKSAARLLVVDDDPDIVQILQIGLQRNRFLVDAFTNPEQALQSFKSNASGYSLVILDIRMPELSGIQLARKVKEANPNVKIILMTAFEIRGNEFSKVFPSTAVDGFVQKPIGLSDLNKKVMSLIGYPKERISNDQD